MANEMQTSGLESGLQSGRQPSSGSLCVQICYICPPLSILLTLSVAPGTTIQQAIQASGILLQVPEIDLATQKVGIFNKVRALDTVLREQDRIEIYRPLVVDPKTARRQRVEEKRVQQARLESMPRSTR